MPLKLVTLTTSGGEDIIMGVGRRIEVLSDRGISGGKRKIWTPTEVMRIINDEAFAAGIYGGW